MAEEIEVNLVVDNEEGKAKLDEFATRLAAVSAAAGVVLDKLQGKATDGLFGQTSQQEAEDYNTKVQEVSTSATAAAETLNTDTSEGMFSAENKDRIEEVGEALDETGKKARRAGRELRKVGQDKKSFPQQLNDKMKDTLGVLGDLLPRNLRQLQRGFKQAQRGTRSFTTGLKGMKKALISTGIGALVVALGELVANWDKITAAINGASDESQKLVDSANEMREQADMQYEAIEATTNQLLLQGKTEEDIAAMREQALDDQILAAQLQLEYTKAQRKEMEETMRRNQEIAMALLGALEMPVTLLLGVVDSITEAMAYAGILTEGTTLAADFLQKQAEMLGFDVEETQQESEEAISKAESDLNKLVERRAANEVRRQKEQESEDKRRREQYAREREEQTKFLDALLKEEEEYGKTQEQLAMMRLKAQQEAELEKAKALKLSQEDIMRLEKQHAQEREDLEKEQAERRQQVQDQEMARVNDALKSDLDRRLDAVSNQYDELIRLAEKYGMDTTELEAKRQAELDKMRADANDQELRDVQSLARELELLNMTEQQAQFERERDAAKRRLDERLSVAMGNQELERQVREQFRLEMARIDAEEQDSYLDSRREMFASMQDFVGKIGGLYKQMESLVKAQAEAEILAAKERGASEEEIAKLEQAAVERERRMAVTQVLLQQAQALASGLQGAVQAATSTGPAAPFTLAAYIATMVGTIIAGFAQVKNILNQAKADSLSIGNAGSTEAGRAATQALTPNLVTDLSNEPSTMRTEQSFKAYVVASEVQGQNADYGNIVQNASL